ncbi:hypothetical protein [Microbacterium sp. C7(2022)]|uniref:hypothetical protein n=1 Tax=Microbacterium sp. C7(2022) TaxID=2992759 RepID=UPI00237BCB67|nr:hypothetical protein [Microbacterium sp. C7(2022)]MDE0546342.1 DUF4352 domain-containing protein [Microbacterium sp. C7(2022)]
MRTSLLLPLAVVAGMTLTGCSAGQAAPDPDHLPETAPVATATPSATPTPTDDLADDATYGERIINDRGNLVKEVGQLAGITLGDSDVTAAQFAVTDIVVDIDCTSEYADSAENGHLVGIHLNIETTPELAQDEIGTVSFSEWGWQAFDADDKRVNDPMGTGLWCMDASDQLPSDIGPAQSVSGWIVLDLPTDHGAVVLTMGASNGWEWAY